MSEFSVLINLLLLFYLKVLSEPKVPPIKTEELPISGAFLTKADPFKSRYKMD